MAGGVPEGKRRVLGRRQAPMRSRHPRSAWRIAAVAASLILAINLGAAAASALTGTGFRLTTGVRLVARAFESAVHPSSTKFSAAAAVYCHEGVNNQHGCTKAAHKTKKKHKKHRRHRRRHRRIHRRPPFTG